MRIPHVINKNTMITYTPSETTLTLLGGEVQRRLLSEEFTWDETAPESLNDLCMKVISNNFERYPIFYELPAIHKEFLFDTVSTDLPLKMAIHLIKEEHYWKRRFFANFKETFDKHPNWTWKCLYLERYIQKLIEEAEPQYNDEENVREVALLCQQYIHRLNIQQLQHWSPPRCLIGDEIPRVYPTYHINLKTVLEVLPNITQLDIMFGMSNVGEKFDRHMFKISPEDLGWLGEGVACLKELKVLNIHRSALDDPQVRALVRTILKSESLEVCSMSQCDIKDKGALCIANMISDIPTLKILKLRDNMISVLGMQGPNVYLDHLDLSLNLFSHEAVVRLLSALVRGTNLRELSLSGCAIHGHTAVLVGRMIALNSSLVMLDISNNYFAQEGGEAIRFSLETNMVLQRMDFRNTEIPSELITEIQESLDRNVNIANASEKSTSSSASVQSNLYSVELQSYKYNQ